MKFNQSHAGKWVAAKDEKIVGAESTLAKLMQKVKKRRDWKEIRYSLIPKGFIVG